MNKKIGIIIGVVGVLIILGGLIFYINIENNKNKQENNVNQNNNQNDKDKNPVEENNNPSEDEKLVEPTLRNGYYEINEGDFSLVNIEETKITKSQNENVVVLYDSSKKYSKSKLEDLTFLDNLDLEHSFDISEYLKYFFYIFKGESKTKFTKDDMSIVLAYAASMTESPRDENYIKSLAKRYFNVDNFEMTTGLYKVIYSTLDNDEFTIMKKDGYYISSATDGRCIDLAYNPYMTDIKVNGSNVTIYYDYALDSENKNSCYNENLSQEDKAKCRIGTYKIDITMNKEKQIFAVNKIEYTKEK